MIELAGVWGGYQGVAVVRDICARFAPGELNLLIGPNGCGKSTLLRMAAGLQPPQRGQVLLDGRDIGSIPPKELARQVAYLPQSRNIHPITVRHLVLHGRFPHLGYPRRYRPRDLDAAGEAMAQMGISHLADQSMEALSGGERQKAFLAMLLAQGGQVVFLDEPTTYLDIGHQLEVLRLARRLKDLGKTVVLILHDLNLAMGCADRVFLMDRGRLCCQGTPEEVFASGLLGQVFGVAARRVDTPDAGPQYYFF